MNHDHRVPAWLRPVTIGGVVAAGLVAIVGSGGGSLGFPETPPCLSTGGCPLPVTPPVVVPTVSISPLQLVVQAGTSATFSAQSSGIDLARYQWQRSAGGVNFVDVVGATSATYTIGSTQFADDGAQFRVAVRDGANVLQVISSAATLLVSSMPAVVFTDGEFDPTDWSASAIADPAQNGPTHTEDRSATGGLPGAFRRMVHTMTIGPSSLGVFNAKASAVYDPKVLGAIRAIDYAEDCNRIGATTNTIDVGSFAMFEQAGRRYVSFNGRGCLSLWVNNFAQLRSLLASDFRQADGPACGTGESCPDFSASAAPLRFGFARSVSRAASAPAASIEHGIDNWKINVWRP